MIDSLLPVDPGLVPFLQMASSAILALASLFVGVVALRFNHRNNFGAPPKVLVVSVGGARPKDAGEDYATFTCRIQNRRTYPIEAKFLWARLPSADVRRLIEEDKRIFDCWYLHSDGWFMLELAGEVEPGKHNLFEGTFPARQRKRFHVPLLHFTYFDPVAGDWYSVRNSWRNRTAWRRRDLRLKVRHLVHRTQISSQ